MTPTAFAPPIVGPQPVDLQAPKPDPVVVEPDPPMLSMAELCEACDAHADCTLSAGAAVCTCQSKYIGDGETCTFDASCSALNCETNSKCVADEAAGELSCECKPGYAKAAGSKLCEDVDECAALAGDPCASMVTTPYCLNTDGGSYCACTPRAKAANLLINGDFALFTAPWEPRLGPTTTSWALGRAAIVVPASPEPAYNDLNQQVAVKPGATYTLTADVQSSPNGGGFPCSFAARIPGTNTMFGFKEFAPGFNGKLSTECLIPSDISNVQVYVGCWNLGDNSSEMMFSLDNISFVQTAGVGLCN